MRYFLLVLICFNTYRTWASEPAIVKYDSSEIHARSLSDKAIDAYLNDGDFKYERTTRPPTSLVDRFLAWLETQLSHLGETKGAEKVFMTVLIILAVSIIVFFIIRATGMSTTSLFGKTNRSSKLQYTSGPENIHTINFEDAIRGAISNRDFRLGVRLLYLQVLKNLSDRELITWRIDKTNIAYVQELKGTKYEQYFDHLTCQFENNWYGELPITEQEFSNVSEKFIQFNRQIK